MNQKISDFIRELSEIYDAESMDTFVSLYLNKNTDNKFIERRIKACESVLKKEELKNFKDTMDNIQDIINKNTDNNLAVFSSHKHGFLKYVPLSIRVENLLIVDSSPYLRPLARILDEWESFTLLLMSSNQAKIFSVSLGKIKNQKNLSADIINKHKKGGWSQARFNRLRKGSIKRFFTEIEEVLKKTADEQIILAGPGIAKSRFRDFISKNLNDKIIETIDLSIDDEQELFKESIHLIAEKEERKSQKTVLQLKQEILKDGLAVYGVKDTLNAVKNGQVELLLIEKKYKPRGWICEHCQVVEEGKRDRCPYCGKKTSDVDVLEEILEFAERTDAEIEFTDDKEIKNLGHIGAFLRYK